MHKAFSELDHYTNHLKCAVDCSNRLGLDISKMSPCHDFFKEKSIGFAFFLNKKSYVAKQNIKIGFIYS